MTTFYNQQQEPFIKRFDLIHQFFVSLRNMAQNPKLEDSLDDRQDDDNDSVKKEVVNPTTQREDNKTRKKRVNYLSTKKTLNKMQEKKSNIIRPSDMFAMEQNKKLIDQLCNDNFILNNNLQDALKVIDILKDKLKVEKKQSNEQLLWEIKQLKFKLDQKEKELKDKNKMLKDVRSKNEELMKELDKFCQEIDGENNERDKQIIDLETQNLYLRKLLGITFNEEQLQLIEKQQDESEFNFFDNFCISRRDLEKQAIEQYEKVLSQRRNNIEQQFIDWHVVYMNEQNKQQENMIKNQRHPAQNADFLMFQDEEEPFEAKKPKQTNVSKEEKDRIMQELLKPIGSSKQQQKIDEFAKTGINNDVEDADNNDMEDISEININKSSSSNAIKSDSNNGSSSNIQKMMMHGDLSLDQQINLDNEFIQQKQQTQQEDDKEEKSGRNKDKNKLSLSIDLIEQDQNKKQESEQQKGEDQQQESQQDVKKKQKEIMQSLEQGWQKLMQSKQQKSFGQKLNMEDEDEEAFTYQGFPGQNMFAGPQTIEYDQDDYFDDEDEDEIYQNIIQKQKLIGSKLQKTSKNEELQNRNKLS